MKKIILLITITIILSSIINAQTEPTALSGTDSQPQTRGCCLRTSAGAICQTATIEGNEASCPGGWIQGASCEEVAECGKVCCMSKTDGYCTPNSPLGECEAGGDTWNEAASCNINQCQKNCCVIGDRAYYVTERECSRLAGGQEKNYVGVNNANECLLMGGLKKKGACTYERDDERRCSFGTKEECLNKGGSFSENLLCSNPELETICQKQKRTACIEGLDGVYWIDSCENRENIWEGNTQAQKDNSWNNGIVKPKQQSCTYSNSNKQCGNCDRFGGSTCSTTGTGAICKTLDCPDAQTTAGTRDRKNGESWCVYESEIGNGKDVPGSLHYRYSCVNGEVRSEACGDRRTSICDEETIESGNSSIKHSRAICRPNLANECLSYNKLKPKERAESCQANSDCYYSKTNYKVEKKILGFYAGPPRPIIETRTYATCLPRFPIAYQKLPEDTTAKKKKNKINPDICARGNFACPGTSCGKEFSDAITEMCISIGDCGPSTNIAGNFTTGGYSVKGASKISSKEITRLKANAVPKTNFIMESSEFVKNTLKSFYDSSITTSTYNPTPINPKTIFQLIKLKARGGQKYYCQAWEAPIGGRDCEKCSQSSRTCTEYRCSTFGTACELINKGTKEEVCANIAIDDNTAPAITPLVINESFSYETSTSHEFKLRMSNGECIPEYTELPLAVKSNEYAKCAWSEEPIKGAQDQEGIIGKDDNFRINHSVEITMPSAEQAAYELLDEQTSITLLQQEINEKYNNMNYYVKCYDRAGNSELDDYRISTCIKPRAIDNPPAITRTEPSENSYFPHKQESFEALFFTEYPATCKWSETAGKNYSSMENDFNCKTRIEEATAYGWECSTTFTGLKNEDKEYYVKCKSKPWLEGTNRSGERKESEDFTYKVRATKTPLNISAVLPENGALFYAGIEPFDIKLKLTTNGGADGGVANCKYSTTTINGSYHYLKNTYSTSHQMTFNTYTRGNKTVFVKCTDSIGNTATAQTSFSLIIDTAAPAITRAYNAGGNLVVMTDEDSECAYSKSSCSFDFYNENATRMLGINKAHTTEWNRENTYFIKCKDKYGNPKGDTSCSMIIRPYEEI